MKPLRARIDEALEDRDRFTGFDARVWAIHGKRLDAASRHPDWDELRGRAAAIKAHTISRMHHHITGFTERAEAAGARVHFASDAAALNTTIQNICQEQGATRVTKSKSMTTEECHLNEHLAEHGIEVVDTDLGERIVQLLGEPPSHIIAPAIHRSAREIGELFSRTMGAPAGETDPGRLTAIARTNLREIFLAAEVGITGVNFAVAETGTVVVVENEGNSLLTTSVPDVHVAVMGIEKVIPRWADLPVFLNLLARSATGQRITTYTTHYTGPQERGPGEEDRPPRQLHIVILDNGRTRVLADEDHSRTLACIRCGACMNVCPVYRRSGGHAYGWVYPGPIGSVLAPAMGPGGQNGGAELPFASSLCGACTEACPVGIDLHQQLVRQRHRMLVERRKKGPGFRRLGWLLRHPRLTRFGMKVMRRLLGRLKGRVRSWEVPQQGQVRRELPEAPRESFTEWWQRNRRERR